MICMYTQYLRNKHFRFSNVFKFFDVCIKNRNGEYTKFAEKIKTNEL